MKMGRDHCLVVPGVEGLDKQGEPLDVVQCLNVHGVGVCEDKEGVALMGVAAAVEREWDMRPEMNRGRELKRNEVQHQYDWCWLVRVWDKCMLAVSML